VTAQWIALAASIVGNPEGGYHSEWHWDGARWPTPAAAIDHGFGYGRSDDFNIGKIVNGRLVELRWMDDTIHEDESTLARISATIGLGAAS
jgi:hypothetical protein